MYEFEASNACFMTKDTTSYYADSVEWCPFKHFSNFFACGTYQLTEELSAHDGQIRLGNVILYKLNSSDDDSDNIFNISIQDCISTNGILDMKWNQSHLYGEIILALVCSDGKILLKYIKEDENRVQLLPLYDHNLAINDEKILLSIDWSNQNENSASLITSDNKGALNYLQVREAEMSILSSWKAHNFESWVAAFNYSNPNIVYSGGDDCLFKTWDTRSIMSPIFVKKNHSMGVTAIAKSKLNENLLVTGSYDENIFLWDVRNIKSPLSSLQIGGGVWRLKWHPTNSRYLLSAAMHNGFHVLSINNDGLKMELSYNHHKSLAYGVDWSYLTSESPSYAQNNELLSSLKKCNIKNIIASCSFYDKLLHVWGIN